MTDNDERDLQIHRQHDAVNHPKHYNSHPDGMECIELVELLPFCEGNAIKYLWRAGLKGAAVEDLRKALWYVERASLGQWRPPLHAVYHATLVRACNGFRDELVREAIHEIGLGRPQCARPFINALIEQTAVESAA